MLKYGDRVKFIAKYSCVEEMYNAYESTTAGYGDGMFDEYLAFVRGEKTGCVTNTGLSIDGTPIVRLGSSRWWYMQQDLAKVPGTLTEII